MNYYTYDGPILNNFNQVISNKWEGETYANTDGKASSNLRYQIKKEFGLLPSAKVILSSKPVRS